MQAMDLAGRKTVMVNGQWLKLLINDIGTFITGLTGNERAQEFVPTLVKLVAQVDEVTSGLVLRGQADPDEIGASAVDYLHLLGYFTYAYMWVKQIHACERDSVTAEFAQAKLETARYYYAKILPTVSALVGKIEAGSAVVMALNEDAF